MWTLIYTHTIVVAKELCNYYDLENNQLSLLTVLLWLWHEALDLTSYNSLRQIQQSWAFTRKKKKVKQVDARLVQFKFIQHRP